MADEFISLPVPQSARDFKDLFVEAIRSLEAFEDWDEDEAALDNAIAEGDAAMLAQLAEIATTVSTRLYMDSGQRLDGVMPILPEAATGVTTWTGSAGPYTISAGSTVGLDVGGGQLAYFQTVDDYEMGDGDTSLADVAVTATTAGTAANGLSGAAVIVDAPAEISGVTFTDTTGGGKEGETLAEYLDRLTRFRRLRSAVAVKPTDYAPFLAESIPTAVRAGVLDGYRSTNNATTGYTVAAYDPEDMGTWEGGSIAVVPIDEDGEALGSEDFTAANVLFNGDAASGVRGIRLAGYNVEVLNPHYTIIDVTVTVAAWSGFDPDDVEAQVTAALEGFLSPASYGQPSYGETPALDYTPLLKQSDLIAAIMAVESVKGISSGPTFAKQGNALATTTVTLDTSATEPFPLTRPGVVTVTVA